MNEMNKNGSKPNLSAYKIYWVEITPTKGKYVTKHDQKAIGEILPYRNRENVRKPFGSKAAALTFLRDFKKKLDKRYEVRLFTDKQFSLATEENNYAIPYTRKQLKEVYYIG